MVLTESNHVLKKGDKAPEFNLIGTDREYYSLEKLKGKQAYLIVFMCNHCPYVLAKLEELNRIACDYKDKLSVIGVNPNEDKNYPEDSFENMQKFVSSGKINFLYLRDETQEVAKAYGAVCTPDPFLFDSEFKLIFHSRIDDPPGTGSVKKHELHEAIEEFLEKESISMRESPSVGCGIKWE